MADPGLVARLRDQNPWWTDPGATSRDPDLVEAATSPVRWRPPLIREMDLERPNVYTIRGPRQVGKTTLLKMLISDLLTEPSPTTGVLYYSLDLERDPATIVDVVRLAKQLLPDRRRWCIFLDEVSSVPDWQRGIKYLRDQTDARADAFVLTGSSATDIRTGGERLPGRRGPGRVLDKLLLPMGFRDFCHTTGRAPVPHEPMSLDDLLRNPADLNPLLLHLQDLEAALVAYAETGGFPRAVRELLEGRPAVEEWGEVLWQMVAGELERRGRDRVVTLKVLSRAARSLGTPVSWRTLATEAGVASPTTAAEYATLLAESFTLLVVPSYIIGQGHAPRRGKKLFFADPLFARLPHLLDASVPVPPLPALVENLVALALFEAVEREPVESFALPQRLFWWRSAGDREIDFVVRPSRRNIPVEVKYQSRITGKDREAMRKSFGRGILLSRDQLREDALIATIPAAVFLAVLAR